MNFILIGLLVSIIFAAVAYLSTSNLIVGIIIAIVSILYFIFIANKEVTLLKTKINRFNECYYFINNFIVTLSVKGSLKASFDSVSKYASNELDEVLVGIQDLNENEKIRYLQKYFKFHIFHLFVDLLDIYQEEGGDIISMSNYLINQLRITEEYIIKVNQMNNRKLFEFSTLWIFSLVILVTLRFALSEFYSYLKTQIFYLIGIGIVFIFILISIHLLILKMKDIDLRGWTDEK